MNILLQSASVQANGGEGVAGSSGSGISASSFGANGAPGHVVIGGLGSGSDGGTTPVTAANAARSGDAGPSPTLITTGAGDDTIQISGSNMVVDAGAGTNSIFILGGSSDSVVLHADGTDVISGFSLANNDTLDLRALFSEANLSLAGDMARLGSYVHVSNTNGTASVAFDPTSTWATPGSTIAVLENVGNTVTSLADLVAGGAVRIA